MPLSKKDYLHFLNEYALSLDISPSKYKQAVDRYKAVGEWITNGEYEGCDGLEPIIEPQGSFGLGTVIRPFRNSRECEYDIDLISELQLNPAKILPQKLKKMVGDRLKENEIYKPMLDKEGRRCWTILYAEQDGIGFHLDVLPCAPQVPDQSGAAISITHKENNHYSYLTSDPRGFCAWFREKNQSAYLKVELDQKNKIVSRYSSIYSSIEEVPYQLVKTPLQQVIQIMKRHRDMMFDHPDFSKYKPISMIITTLAAQLYQGEDNVYDALKNIITKLSSYSFLLKRSDIQDDISEHGFIQRNLNGEWYIPNPVNREENFADRWHEDEHARAKAFFMWVDHIQKDLIDVLNSYDRGGVRKSLVAALGSVFVDTHFNSIWPLVNPNPNIKTNQITIAEGRQPWGEFKNGLG